MNYVSADWEKAVWRKCKRRRYSVRTAKNYIYCIGRFLNFTKKDLGHESPETTFVYLHNSVGKMVGIKSTWRVYDENIQ